VLIGDCCSGAAAQIVVAFYRPERTGIARARVGARLDVSGGLAPGDRHGKLAIYSLHVERLVERIDGAG
jgi:hypothetical protein